MAQSQNPTTHPVGTPITSIRTWDRSTKVGMVCTNHPEAGTWWSKQPAVSWWFPSSADQGDGCQCGLNYFVTAHEYTA